MLLGAYKISVTITEVASLGILASIFYALRVMQHAFHGPTANAWRLSDLTAREGLMVGAMIAALL